MSELSHLRLENTATTLPYTSPQQGRPSEFPTPPRDRGPHAQKLIGEVRAVAEQVDAERGDQHAPGKINGYPLRLASDPEFSLRLESLDRRQDGVELLSVKSEAGVQVANVFVRKDKLVTFVRLIERYRDEATDAGKPKNQKLVDSIAAIRQVAVRDLWQDSAEFPGLGQPIWWEVWIRSTAQSAEEAFGAFAALARERELRVGDHFVVFPERVVLLVWATARQLGESVDLLSYIAELRRAKEIPTEYLELPPRDQRAVAEDVLHRLTGPSPDAPAVCLLDTGVNRHHPLIAPALAPADAQAVDPAWGTADHDHDQHGTGMAGVAVYRCLTDVFNSAGPVNLRHRLESVKLLPPPPMANDPDVYGWVTQQAVARAEIQAPERNRAICMAITTDDRDQGLPSSWSAAIDQMCASDPDQDHDAQLMFISAGNYAAVLTNPGYAYPDWNHQYAGVQDPAQSWNAVTVGASTELVSIHDPTFLGWQPIAPAGDLTPSSRTSLAWPEENYDWPIKPDIVMEGGNYVTDGTNRDCCTDLSLLTTIMHPTGRLLTHMRDTSAATAQAARLAAIIWSYYPRLWPETVRGLMIHSAQWTRAMIARIPGVAKGQVHRRLRCFGYGVPSVSRALWSAENAATLIYEGELQPFHKLGGVCKTNELHLHRLPWPADTLADLGEVPVTMRITLSYFMEPSPGRRGWGVKHRFQSHGLRFEVINPLETEQQFAQRISAAMWAEDGERPNNVPETRHWIVGRQGRTRGSVHSDWWEGTAAELARCGMLAVYPVTGWWRERPHLGRYNRKARYSLIVSIETPDVAIDLYAPIANLATVSTELGV